MNDEQSVSLEKLKILAQSESVKCEGCGNYTFEQVLLLKRISALMTSTGRPEVVPVPTFGCAACGNINNDFVPSIFKQAPLEEESTGPTKPKLILE